MNSARHIVSEVVSAFFHLSQSINPRLLPDNTLKTLVVLQATILLALFPARNAGAQSPGRLDPNFGAGGKVTTRAVLFDNRETAAVIQADEKITAAGSSSGEFFTMTENNPGDLDNKCRPVSDFNGDRKSDYGVFHSGSGEWRVILSPMNNLSVTRWGLGTDRIAPADYNGDCRTDAAVFRDGDWYIANSSGTYGFHFGQAGDIPVPADYDGDDLADAAVYRSGIWYIQRSRDGFAAVRFGLATDKPVVGADFDGDGKDDIAVYRPSEGAWYMMQSTGGFRAVQFGLADDKPVIGDYDGDNKTDIAVYRPNGGNWYLLGSTRGFSAVQFGIASDVPVPADYDGDGKTDIAVYRTAAARWYFLLSGSGFSTYLFGSGDDRPIAAAYIP